jgi:hypothetical protein
MLPESDVKIVNIEMQWRNEPLQNCMTRYFLSADAGATVMVINEPKTFVKALKTWIC